MDRWNNGYIFLRRDTRLPISNVVYRFRRARTAQRLREGATAPKPGTDVIYEVGQFTDRTR